MASSYTLHTQGARFGRSQWTVSRRPAFRSRISSFPAPQSRRLFYKPRESFPCYAMRGLICFAVLPTRALSQTADHAETSLRRMSPAAGKGRQSLTRRKQEPSAKVEFQLKFRTDYGHQIKMVGSAAQFGSWAIAKCPAMTWLEGDLWTVTIQLPVGNIYEYKYVVVDAQGASVIRWQQGNNCILAIGLTDKELVVGDNWEGNPGASVTSRGKGISTKEERLLDWAAEVKSQSGDNSGLVRETAEMLQKAQEENSLVQQEVSRLKSELRMTAMTRQAAEQQVKELQQENRRLMALLAEQQSVHKTVMEQTLCMLKDTESPAAEEAKPSASAEVEQSGSEDGSPPGVAENGVSAEPSGQKRRRPRRKSNRPRRSRVSTRTAAIWTDL